MQNKATETTNGGDPNVSQLAPITIPLPVEAKHLDGNERDNLVQIIITVVRLVLGLVFRK